MTKQLKEAVRQLPYYTKIQSKGRYSGIKAKAWSILSDYVRLRDFILHKVCVSCNKTIYYWRDTDAGHFISMGGHGALIGFHHLNIHAQCKNCNQMASAHTGAQYERTLIRRGIDPIELEILADKSIKADDWFFLEKIKEIYKLFQELKDKNPMFDYPEYLSTDIS